MTVGRGLALLAAFVATAVSLIHLRAEQIHLSARAQELRNERVQLRQESWALQVEIARLRTPAQIRNRVDRWRLEVCAPHRTDRKLASGHVGAR